jgi:hypothetical protein
MSTSAFAAVTPDDQRTWKSEGQSKDIMEALKININKMYGSVAADTAVYQSVKSIDKMMGDMVDEMMKGYKTTPNGSALTGSDLKDAVMAGLRSTIGGQISDYLTKHTSDYFTTNALGRRSFDPVAYANTFAKAASEAVSSAKAVAGIQSYMYYIFQRSAFNQAAEDIASLRNEMEAFDHWDDYGFNDLNVGSGAWFVPSMAGGVPVNVDHTMANIFAVYNALLSTGGMLGVDYTLDGWDTGIAGNADLVDGFLYPTIDNGGNEVVNTPIYVDNVAPFRTPDDVAPADGRADEFRDGTGAVILPGWNNN